GRELERVEAAGLATAFPRHVLPDVYPEVAEDRHFLSRDVVGHGDAGQLDDAALDGVHEREVGHGPGEECTFGVARAAQEKGGGREVDYPVDAELAVDGFEPADPEAGGLVVFLRLLFLLTRKLALGAVVRFLPVTVVGFVVQHQDVFHPQDRKSTRLNSSHVKISYAVFCLKK